ncbi:MAG: spore germination protein [Oscillospiraceae bacterium]|nr:spore germination protein [Oscillospiraceae bacterium]
MKETDHLPPALEDVLAGVRQLAHNSADLTIGRVTVGDIPCALLTCEGMVSQTAAAELLIAPLTAMPSCPDAAALFTSIRTRHMMALDRPTAYTYADLFGLVHAGFAVLCAEGAGEALGFGLQGYERRGVTEPMGEASLLGGHEGLTESVRTNMAMLRRRMKTPRLTYELRRMGTLSRTDVCLCWLTDRADPALVSRVREQIAAAQPETVLTPGYVMPFLEAHGGGLFDTVGYTERPDVLAARLLEGRVAVLIDGMPQALTVPRLFVESFQSIDDHSFKPWYATFLRWMKYAAFLIALLLPALYVAVSMHHPELLERTLLLLLTAAEADEPLSLPLEGLGVLVMYEIVREAGLRLPKVVGGAVSIVAGIIIGDAAVASGLVSTPMLTMTAIAVTAGFIVPDLAPAIAVLRIAFLLAGGLWGLTGIALLGLAVLFRLCAAEGMGYPLTAPVTPFHLRGMRDVATRVGFLRMQHGGFNVREYREGGAR